MILRGSPGRIALAALALAIVVSPFAIAGAASPPPTINENSTTLMIALPGPFKGCTSLDSGANASSNAILDLVRPSAFLTSPGGNLYGAGGPIASAELTSLQPETVVYTIAPDQKWSNGQEFAGIDLVAWWQRAVSLTSVQSDGYRQIKSLTVTDGGLKVVAVFKAKYAEWNLLFRDLEQPGTSIGCSLSGLVNRPSLGPYVVSSATSSRVVLNMNTHWTQASSRFGRIVLSTTGTIPASTKAAFVGYSLVVNRAREQALSAHPWVLSHIGSSSNIEEMTFAPGRALTKSLGIRQALSWSLNRQAMINQLWGAVTFSVSPAASALFSQGQSAYPGYNGSNPTSQATTSTTTLSRSGVAPGLDDCLQCAFSALTTAGYHRTKTGFASRAGAPLTVRLVVGPSVLDKATAALVAKRWKAVGITVHTVGTQSDIGAAAEAASNHADVAIFARPTLTTPSYAARSWSGPSFVDTYQSGVRSAVFTALFNAAVANFNPVAANTTWLLLDQALMSDFWVRPLFTAPSVVEWSNTIATVSGSISVPGFLDQVTTWSATAPPSLG
jgi:peptide/nickel transport system substrate-binding protein